MKTAPFSFVLKTVLLFSTLAIVIDICRTLIYLKFDLTRFFEPDYLLYEVLLEYAFVSIAGFITYFVAVKIKSTELGPSIVIALVYSIIYSLICLIATRIIVLMIGITPYFKLDVYNSFLKFMPTAFYVGLLYVLVLRTQFKKLDLSKVE